jgi:inner membrane protein
MVAASLPDLDWVIPYVSPSPPSYIWLHRGFAHSLFVALLIGGLAALFSRQLRATPLTAAVVVGAAAASHGLLDMFTMSGDPVAYLWPVSSTRLFADWRPIYTWNINSLDGLLGRARSEIIQLIIPMFVLAFAVRTVRFVAARRLRAHPPLKKRA